MLWFFLVGGENLGSDSWCYSGMVQACFKFHLLGMLL